MKRYSNIKSTWRAFDKLSAYIFEGYVTDEAIRAEFAEYQGEIENAKQSPARLIYNKLQAFTSLNDSEIPSLIDEAIEHVKKDEYTLYDLMRLYTCLLQYPHFNWGGFIITDEIERYFIDALWRSYDRHSYNNRLNMSIPMWDNNDQSPEHKMYNRMRDVAFEVNQRAAERYNKNSYLQFIDWVYSDNRTEINKFCADVNNRDILLSSDWSHIISVMQDPNRSECAIYLCEKLRTLIPAELPYSKFEIQTIKRVLQPWLDDFIKENPRQIRSMFFIELNKHLNLIIQSAH